MWRETSLRRSIGQHSSQVRGIQELLREMMLDVALVKRALASIGQVGVMERRKIEKELLLELFPPNQVRAGTGISVAPMRGDPAELACDERLSLCKAACRRIFNVPLTPAEVHEGKIDWNPRMPYAMHKNRLGCVHLRSTECSCSIYGSPSHSRAGRVAQFSAKANLFMMRFSTGCRQGAWRLLFHFATLGPVGWYVFFRDSRILERVAARSRVFRKLPRTGDAAWH